MNDNVNNNPYKGDLLNRNEEFGKGVKSLIENSENITNNKSLVLALDSGWGTGKTWFLKMFKEDLEQDDLKVIYYNAWENDDYEHALIPLISEICMKESGKKEIAEKTAKVIGTTVGVLGRQLITHVTGISTKEISDEIKKVIQTEYEKHKKDKENLREGFEGGETYIHYFHKTTKYLIISDF